MKNLKQHTLFNMTKEIRNTKERSCNIAAKHLSNIILSALTQDKMGLLTSELINSFTNSYDKNNPTQLLLRRIRNHVYSLDHKCQLLPLYIQLLTNNSKQR